jgi:hypothetical protein
MDIISVPTCGLHVFEKICAAMLAIESLSKEPLVLDDVVTERGVETHS